MARVKRGVTAHAKHKKVLKKAKGFYGRRKNTIRAAKAAVDGNFSHDESMQWHKILYEKGWVAPHWPKEVGGPGLDVTKRFILSEELELAGDLPPVQADPAQLEQVLLNLVLNARDAMPEGGTLTLATRRAQRADTADLHPRPDHEGLLAIAVRDTGTGMDERTRQQVFEPFFTTKEVGKGTGQGLAISQDVIVNKHDGELLCDVEDGVGTTFTIKIPLTAKDTKGAAA